MGGYLYPDLIKVTGANHGLELSQWTRSRIFFHVVPVVTGHSCLGWRAALAVNQLAGLISDPTIHIQTTTANATGGDKPTTTSNRSASDGP